MKYQTLYRKYRPSTFDEVYGQEIVKKILINSINNNKINHAYLFYGPRGTGKTSVAKMFARIINCENLKNATACNVCASCKQSVEKECIDIIEIDAASNNGVDEIRELKNKINLVPNYLKYKVYIIDEVHMLSSGAFNALLKTLEEPPEHVIFILATTEIYQIPSTIISRCQMLEFKNIDNISLKNRLLEIAKKEKIVVDELAVDEIIKNCNGGMRDGIGLLDKLNSYCDKAITSDDVRSVLGIVSISEIEETTELLINKERNKLLDKIKLFGNTGQDLVKIVGEIVINLRNEMLDSNRYDYVDLMNDLLQLQNNMINSHNKAILFELYIISKTNVRNKEIVMPSEENIIKSLEEGKTLKKEIIKENKPEVDKSFLDIRINNTFVEASKEILNNIKKLWKELDKSVFDSDDGSIVCDLVDSVPVVASEKYLTISCKYITGSKKINESIKKYEKILKSRLDINVKLVAVSEDKWETIKKEFVKNVKNGIKYEYIEEETTIPEEIVKPIKKNNKLKDKAKELFGDLVV